MKNLLRQAKSGDAEAFAELFDGYATDLWRTAVSIMHDESTAADMLQETTIKAWQSLPSFNGKSKLKTWLTRILLNTCFDELKSRKKITSFADLDELGETPSFAFASAAHTADGTEEAIRHLDVQNALDALAPADRLVLTLFYVDDLSISEAADMLGITVGAMRTRLSRARSRFKEIYASEEEHDSRAAGKTQREIDGDKNECSGYFQIHEARSFFGQRDQLGFQ